MSGEYEAGTDQSDGETEQDIDTGRVIEGDSLEQLDDLPEDSVHAIVTDPPYGLAFMGRDWDDFEPREYQDWCQEWAEKALRVLKPGGHLLAFSGNRTHHRLFAGVEDAGFTVRDTLTWHYGSGFPKNTDTQLKPSTEFVVVARKPYSGAAKDCHDEHGTAYLNIEGCRIESGERPKREQMKGDGEREKYGDWELETGKSTGTTTEGRYPANLVLDEDAADQLDEQTGELESTGSDFTKNSDNDTRGKYGVFSGGNDRDAVCPPSSGGASRFFYCSKATKSERTLDGKIDNAHPTVKPVDLMEWLVKLVTREGQTVLDPFCGSGTTLRAAKNLGREFVGIEKQAKWCDVARARCGLTPDDPEILTEDDQSALSSYGSEA